MTKKKRGQDFVDKVLEGLALRELWERFWLNNSTIQVRPSLELN